MRPPYINVSLKICICPIIIDLFRVKETYKLIGYLVETLQMLWKLLTLSR